MVRYGMRRRQGACTFADPWGERLQLAWQRNAPRPDLERLLSDLRARESVASEDDDPRMRDLHEGAWQGLVIEREGMTVTRAVCHDASEPGLLELTISWRDGYDEQREKAMLASTRYVPAQEFTTWQAFGIAARIPSRYELAECRCLPGDARLGFRAGKALPSLTLRRLGFTSVWLRQPLADWLAQQLPARSRRACRDREETPAGHALEVLHSRHRLRGLRQLLAGSVPRADYACLCPAEQRVYHVVEEGAAEERRFSLRCACGELLAGGEADAGTP